MNPKTLRAEALLLLASAIWGFAFVAQRVGMESMGPFLFNGLRFGIGGLALLPLALWKRGPREPGLRGREAGLLPGILPRLSPGLLSRLLPGLLSRLHARFLPGLLPGFLLGLLLFGGASLQQIGLVTTTAGKAGFITGLYVLLVPLLGMLGRSFPPGRTWFGAALATLGLYLLSLRQDFSIAPGDAYVLAGAFLWALHVLLVERLSQRQGLQDEPFGVLHLAISQFAVCSLLSLLVAWRVEPIAWPAIEEAAIPLLYGSLGSVSIAYTLQLLAQRQVPAAPAAIILSMETVFAAAGGWLLLGERLDSRALLGCGLMLLGILSGRPSGNPES